MLATLEQAFSEYIGLDHAVAVNSCTAALHLALEAIGLKEGEAVLVPTMTFAATAEVVRYFKAMPILVDCRALDLNMDVEDARRKLQWAQKRGIRTRAIMVMHYGGQIGDVAGVQHLARDYDLRIIEDAAHCCPGKYRHAQNEPWFSVGSFSDISCYSFYANKCITTGEGGMACTNSSVYADRIRIMALHGISRDAWKRFTADGSWYYEILAPGFKYNLTDIAAGIGIHQLRKADFLHRERIRIAKAYSRLLADIDEIELPVELPNRVHSWHLFAIRLKLERLQIDRAEFISELKRKGIGASVHWMPLHMHPYYQKTGSYQAHDFPVAASAYECLVSLPIFPGMKEDELAFISGAIHETIAAHLKTTLKANA